MKGIVLPASNGFSWGSASRQQRATVHQDIASVADLTLKVSAVDICFFSGRRTVEEQRALYLAGKSQRLDSRHLRGDAGDLVPVVDGKPTWLEAHCFAMVRGARWAALYLDIPITSGIVWDRDLRYISDDIEREWREYKARREARGMKAFFDGAHLERRTGGPLTR